MADMTALTMASWLPEVWSPLASIAFRTNTVLAPLLDHSWESELGPGRGDTVNIPSFAQNQRSQTTTRATFGTGAALTFNAVTEGQTQLKVDTMETDAHRMPVEMSLQAMPGYVVRLTQGMGQAIAQKVDYKIASDDTNGFDVFTAIGTDNTDVSDDTVLEGETALNDAFAPTGDRFFVVSPATRASLIKVEAYRNSLYATAVGNLPGDVGMEPFSMNGYMGQIYTLKVYMSGNLEAGTSGKKNAMFHREAIAMVMQQDVTVVGGLNIADGLFNEYAAYCVFGIKLVKTAVGREVDGK